jgi:hypothetical protein
MKDPFSAITILIIDKKNIHKLRGEELLRTYASQNSNMYIPFFPSAPQALCLSDKIQSTVQDRRVPSLRLAVQNPLGIAWRPNASKILNKDFILRKNVEHFDREMSACRKRSSEPKVTRISVGSREDQGPVLNSPVNHLNVVSITTAKVSCRKLPQSTL